MTFPRLLAVTRRTRLKSWAARGRTRLRWVGIRLDAEIGEGVVFVRPPLLLAGAEPAGTPGSLALRIGNRVRFAPGVVIEAEPGRDSVIEIGAGTRIGANTHFHLGGGSIRVGAGSEIREGCTLKTSEGEIELAERCFLGYGCVLHATGRVVMEERVAVGDRVRLVDDAHLGANSQVAAGALVRGAHPDGVVLAGVPAEIVKSLADTGRA